MAKEKLLPPALGMVAGCIGSALTIAGPIGEFLGITFGLVLSLYFWFFAPARSIARILGFTAASAAAYIVAQFTTIYSGEFISYEPNARAVIAAYSPLSFFVGGMAGAFLVLLASLLSFSTERTLSTILLRAFLWSMIGGVLGMIGWAAGHPVGDKILSALGREQLLYQPGTNETGYYYSIFLIWQTGMGGVLGALFSDASLRSPIPSDDDPIPPAPRAIWIARYCLGVLTALTLAPYLFSMLFH